MQSSASTEQLKRVIESQHGGNAQFRQSMRVLDLPHKLADWDGVVHVFDLKDHPKSKRAYAWSSAIKGGTKPRYFAVLHSNRVTGPAEAVKAAALAIRTAGSKNRKA
jgi:hypothetical protein